MMLTVPEFIARCDRYCRAKGIKRTTLSKQLFETTDRLDELAHTESDVGAKRLKLAIEKLTGMELALSRAAAR